MYTTRMAILAAAALGLAACSGAAPQSSFSNAVRTDSGINATGSAGAGGGAGGAPAGSGTISTTTVR